MTFTHVIKPIIVGQNDLHHDKNLLYNSYGRSFILWYYFNKTLHLIPVQPWPTVRTVYSIWSCILLWRDFFFLHIFATNFLCQVLTLYMWVHISPAVRLFLSLSLSLLQPDVGKLSHIPGKKLTCFKCQIATRRLIIRVQEHPVSHLCQGHNFTTSRKVNKKTKPETVSWRWNIKWFVFDSPRLENNKIQIREVVEEKQTKTRVFWF